MDTTRLFSPGIINYLYNMTNRNRRTEIQIRLNEIHQELTPGFRGILSDRARYALNEERDDLDIKLSVLEDEINDEDKEIQRAYEAIEDFHGDWSKGIREKFNLASLSDVLDIIEL